MSQTFEERIGGELDALYQGARFLTGGTARSAAALVVETVTLARGEYPWGADLDAFGHWIEGCLVRTFLRRVGGELSVSGAAPPSAAVLGSADPDVLRSIAADDLYAAAAEIPPGPRLALWLVLLRRWSYGEAAEALGIGRDDLREHLGHRETLLRRLVEDARGSKGNFGFGS